MESGAAAAVILSILAHAGLSALGVWAAWHHTTTQMPSVMNIQFAKIPAAVPRVEAAAPPAVRRKAAAPIAKPVAPTPQKITKPVEASPFGRSPKPATEVPPVVAAAPAPVTAVQPDVQIEGGDFPYTIYIDRMKTLIGTRWFRPQVAQGITATVAFVIDRDGTLRDARVETSSGNATFDRGALRAVLESSPLPPLPFGYSGTYLGVHLTFR